MKIILTIIYICFTTSGIFLMKMGGNSLAISFKDGFSFKIGGITFLGFIAYLISFLLWQKLITSFDLSYIVPITTGIVQVIVLLIGLLFFKESINWVGLVGVIMIIIGIVLVAYGKQL